MNHQMIKGRLKYLILGIALFAVSCHESNHENDKQYVPCGDNLVCEVIEFEGQDCYLMPCGDDACLVCPEEIDEKIEAVSTVSPNAVTVSEVLQDGIVYLSNFVAPTTTVTVRAVSQSDRIQIEPQTLVVTPENWDDSQMIRISCQDDGAKNGALTATVSFSYQSDDAQYAHVSDQQVLVTCLDDGADLVDHFIVTKYGITETTEAGKSVRIGIKLNQQPEATVYVHASSGDVSEGTVSPETIEFGGQDYGVEKFFTVTGVDDDDVDGAQTYTIHFDVESKDDVFSNDKIADVSFLNRDNEDAYGPGTYNIRFMAANTTSGSKQSYDEGHGIRIFEAFKPDIVLIQEFNYGDNTDEAIRTFVNNTFGVEYEYYRGTGNIPNGIISRYPILDAGGWKSNVVSDRRWEWAVIDIPGKKDLLAISLHLHTSDNTQEMTPLISQIKAKMNLDATSYYLVAGGDFNTSKRTSVVKKFAPTFEVSASVYPVDQNGNGNTNAKRANPYDWVLFSPDLDALETDIVIGSHTYPNGHVIDSRVYGAVKGYKCSKHSGANELGDISPVQAADSGAANMQHMAVIRDIELTVP